MWEMAIYWLKLHFLGVGSFKLGNWPSRNLFRTTSILLKVVYYFLGILGIKLKGFVHKLRHTAIKILAVKIYSKRDIID